MNFSEKIKYFYETVISENQIERIAEFISPECQIKTGETLIPSGIDGMKEHIRATKQTYPDYRIRIDVYKRQVSRRLAFRVSASRSAYSFSSSNNWLQ